MRKTSSKAKVITGLPALTEWHFYLYNQDFLAKLSFTGEAEIKKLFKGAKIKGDCVYLK